MPKPVCVVIGAGDGLAPGIERGSEYGDSDEIARTYWDVHARRDRNDATIAQPGDVHAIHAADMEEYGIAMPSTTREGNRG